MNSRHFVCSSTTELKQGNKNKTSKYIAKYNTIRKWCPQLAWDEDRMYMCVSYMENDTLLIKEEEYEDTKGVIRIRKSKEDRQHNDQKKKDKQRSTKHTHIN